LCGRSTLPFPCSCGAASSCYQSGGLSSCGPDLDVVAFYYTLALLPQSFYLHGYRRLLGFLYIKPICLSFALLYFCAIHYVTITSSPRTSHLLGETILVKVIKQCHEGYGNEGRAEK
jgi:hypothetical protein